MSTVYRAHDEQLDRPVAFKRLRAELDEQHRFTTRFAGEAKRAASINHPNVVALYDVGTDGGPYIVMELVEGGDLALLLRTEGRLPAERAAQLTADAAAGLQAAHDAGVTHRDVKPGNILVGPDGRGMVGDFGIARAVGDGTLTKTGAVLGSVDYFSPEQTRGERAGPPSDIYALGVVLYELLTGQRPFRGDSPYAIAVDRLHRPAPDPRDVRPDVPAGLAQIATRAMAIDPADRYSSASEMRDALAAWLAADRPSGRGTDVVPVAASSRGDPPMDTPMAAERHVAVPPRAPTSRSRTWVLAALVLALLLVGGYVGGRLLTGGEVGDVLPEVIVGSPGGFAFDNATETPAPTAVPTDIPNASPTPEVTATPSPPAPAPATAAPTPRPAEPSPVPVAAAGPDDAVAAFYGHVAAGRFDAAYDLWSARMKAAYPREENLDGRFDTTASITFDALYVASQSSDAADVQANFTERYDGGSSRSFIGYWRLVLVDGRWLLDEPRY